MEQDPGVEAIEILISEVVAQYSPEAANALRSVQL